ncbi:hypothetical protein ACQJBY_027849 [Aegilops geniculata]
MEDPPHHQANLNLKGFGERWASHNKAPEPNLFVAYALAHKGSFRSATPYNENDTLPAYTSKTAYDRMDKFKRKAKEMRGPEYDVTSEPLDHEVVMVSGGGRKHGKEAIGGGIFLGPPVALSLSTKLGQVSQHLLYVNARLQQWLRWSLDWRSRGDC